jgi:DNA polymerase-3 subunit gamma/tau
VRVLSRAWQMLLKGIGEVQGAARPASAAEMALIRIAHAATLPTLDEALKTLEGGGGRPAVGDGPRPGLAAARGAADAVAEARAPVVNGGGPAMRLIEPRGEIAAPAPSPEPRPAAAPEVRIASLADIAALADAERDLAFKVQVKNYVRPVRIEPGRLDVGLTEDAPKTLLGDMTARLQKWTGRRWIVTLSREAGGQTLAEAEAARRENALLDARADPAVAAILARFPGARIVNVRIPETRETEAADVPEAAAELRPEDDDDED